MMMMYDKSYKLFLEKRKIAAEVEVRVFIFAELENSTHISIDTRLFSDALYL